MEFDLVSFAPHMSRFQTMKTFSMPQINHNCLSLIKFQ